MSYQVGDRVVYEIRESNSPSAGANGSMSGSATIQGEVISVPQPRKTVIVRLEFPQPIGLVPVLLKQSDAKLSKAQA